MLLPERARAYIGPVTNTDGWDLLELRPRDIILSTPPKCGTTWSQAMLMMLIHGRAIEGDAVWTQSKWIDCGFRDRAALAEALGAQPHRRCIKSHTPLDGIPYRDDVHYMVVYRHPIDVHFSLEKHVRNMRDDWLDFMYAGSDAENFERFLSAPEGLSGTDDLSLASLVYHYLSFREWAHLPNIHFFHYSDLKSDHIAELTRMAHILGFDADAALIRDIARATGFDEMKSAAARGPRDADSTFHNEADFFHSASSRKWEGRLNNAQLAAFEDRFTEVLPDIEDRGWLASGSLS